MTPKLAKIFALFRPCSKTDARRAWLRHACDCSRRAGVTIRSRMVEGRPTGATTLVGPIAPKSVIVSVSPAPDQAMPVGETSKSGFGLGGRGREGGRCECRRPAAAGCLLPDASRWSGRMRYSMVTSTGPRSASMSRESTGTGQCMDGDKSTPAPVWSLRGWGLAGDAKQGQRERGADGSGDRELVCPEPSLKPG